MLTCVLIIVCHQVDISATGRSLMQRSSTEYGLSECYREASIIREPRPTSGNFSMKFDYVFGFFTVKVV
jgi:hypothetical protein